MTSSVRAFAALLVCLITPQIWTNAATPEPAADTSFVQEVHQSYTLGKDKKRNDVNCILAVDHSVVAGTNDGAFQFDLDDDQKLWKRVAPDSVTGAVYAVYADTWGLVLGSWQGAVLARPEEDVALLDGFPVTAITRVPNGPLMLFGPDGMWTIANVDEPPAMQPLPASRNVREVVPDAQGNLWLATGMGLCRYRESNKKLFQSVEEILSSDVRGAAFDTQGRLWAACLGGITMYDGDTRIGGFTVDNGMPGINVRCVARGPDGRMWVGTDRGVTRWDGKTWSLRHSHRWLISDMVKDIAFDSDGGAWLATDKGVSNIRPRKLTLAEKAAEYEKMLRQRHVREPGFVEKCKLPIPGETTEWEPDDDDNDGSYTVMYMIMESLRYAVTKDEEARKFASEAFDVQRLLQTITGTPHFIARTMVPRSWKEMHDANEELSRAEIEDMRVKDPRDKAVEVRWRKAEDKKWLWKGDTSSDEMTGHFWGLGMFYDLCADDTQKQQVAELARALMDGIIENGYTLVDIDGKHTRWGVWAPERLNEDPDWAAERGINSLEILSYLKTTAHVTGDAKYQHEYERLIRDHHYGENARHAKTFAPAWRTHIDDELLAMAYPALLKYEQDPALTKLYHDSFNEWYAGVARDQSPFFNFTFGAYNGGDKHLDDSLYFLRECPLDLISWHVDNTHREDVKLVHKPILEAVETDRLLPASERPVMRWDKNSWEASGGEWGLTEWAPTFWLLPYWMGRYYGYIAGP